MIKQKFYNFRIYNDIMVNFDFLSGWGILWSLFWKYKFWFSGTLVVIYAIFMLFNASVLAYQENDVMIFVEEFGREVVSIEFGIKENIDLAVNNPEKYTLLNFFDIIQKIYIYFVYFKIFHWIMYKFKGENWAWWDYFKVFFILMFFLQMLTIFLIFKTFYLPFFYTIRDILLYFPQIIDVSFFPRTPTEVVSNVIEVVE